MRVTCYYPHQGAAETGAHSFTSDHTRGLCRPLRGLLCEGRPVPRTLCVRPGPHSGPSASRIGLRGPAQHEPFGSPVVLVRPYRAHRVGRRFPGALPQAAIVRPFGPGISVVVGAHRRAPNSPLNPPSKGDFHMCRQPRHASLETGCGGYAAPASHSPRRRDALGRGLGGMLLREALHGRVANRDVVLHPRSG